MTPTNGNPLTNGEAHSTLELCLLTETSAYSYDRWERREQSVDFQNPRKIYKFYVQGSSYLTYSNERRRRENHLCCNLAACLAKEHNQKVLLVDLDPQTNASLSLMPEDRWREWAHDNGTMADILEIEKDRKSPEN